MADLIEVESGALPWKPAPDSRVVEVYNEYDIPTAGVVQQHGVDFLFECISEGQSRLSVWIYTLVLPDERAHIEQATPDQFEARMDSALHARAGVLAIALEGLGVLASTHVEDWSQDGTRELDELFELFSQWLDGLREAAELQRAALDLG
jgi:hypothetical protein